MNDILADTHAVLWSLFDPAKLSATALQALTDTQSAGGRILVSTITLIEVKYLVEKRKIVPAMLAGLWATITDPNEPLATVPLTEDVARALDKIPAVLFPICQTASSRPPITAAPSRIHVSSFQASPNYRIESAYCLGVQRDCLPFR